ncbi:unnamed protein product [Rotaria magnacalcarata]|uniref:Uncharacterized protein n=5 Tax=Rotaria magnacalcarata TaxID=392030 RepID=A0A815FGI9_9BILA|nr:unnamed protein product [Rotaria magnacalcarata]
MLGEQLNSSESRGLLLAIDRMREILHGEKVTLPEIVVVGDQSVGKSSVLEAISGIQLPRAQNICTRCPLELRMKTAQDKEYATIRSSVGSTEEVRIDDLTKIADEVTRLTSEIAGKGFDVSPNPIYLTVFKRDILYDLTLIDLPGITRNAVAGQAENIYDQILNLINKYIKPPTAIVLHVIPASVDFTTSESMKLAKVFDQTCQRQLIAASKIDKYDKGIAEKLQGRGLGSMDLQLGCVAVLNRNQDEIDQNISFDTMKQREKQFFIHHKEAFQHLPDEYKGSEQLVQRLATIQQERIRSTFPRVIKDLRKQIAEKKAQLKKIPPSLNTEIECWTFFQSMIDTYRESIHDNVKGEYDQVASTEGIQLLTASTDVESVSENDTDSNIQYDECEEEQLAPDKDDEGHIAYHFYQLQRNFQTEAKNLFADFFSSQYHEIVLREINRTAGVSLPNFPSYQIIQLSSKKLSDAKNVVLERVQEMLAMERRVFTLNHYYMDTVNNIKEKNKKKNDERGGIYAASPPSFTFSSLGTPSTLVPTNSTSSITYTAVSNEAQAAKDIQIALHAYSKVVEKRMTDNIGQTCYHHFITKCALKMDQFLSSSMPPSKLVQYMREPQKQTYLRNKLTHSIQACEEALQLGLTYM